MAEGWNPVISTLPFSASYCPILSTSTSPSEFTICNFVVFKRFLILQTLLLNLNVDDGVLK